MSDDSEESNCPECPAGIPAWVMTFADLMSLLLTFFVLLLSFSTIEAEKFKQIAGSLSKAFGVQRLVEADTTPMGTSIIAQEFSPGTPEQTVVEEVRQTTTEEQPNLELLKEMAEAQAEAHAEQLSQALEQEIKQGLLDVETEDGLVIIRIQEKGSFSSGSADLQQQFMPIMGRIRDEVAATPGKLIVAGHTDDVPIATYRFRSNWELSSARAVSVLHFLLDDGRIDASNVELKGLADTKPLVPNDSRENRARNRRVEIIIAPELQNPAGDARSSVAPPAEGGEGEVLTTITSPPDDTGAAAADGQVSEPLSDEQVRQLEQDLENLFAN